MRLRSAKGGQGQNGEREADKKSKKVKVEANAKRDLFYISTQPEETQEEEEDPQDHQETGVSPVGGGELGFEINTRAKQSDEDEDDEQDSDEHIDDGDDGEGAKASVTRKKKVSSPSDESSGQESSEEEEDAPGWSLPLGRRDAEDAAKGREKREQERRLQNMLFGATLFERPATIKGEHSDDDEEGDDGDVGKEEDQGSGDEDKDDENDSDAAPEPESKRRKKEKKAKRKAVWQDEDDENTLVKDVTATYTKAVGKHGEKETSTERYSRALKRKFVSLMGTPSWADLDKKNKEDSDSDEEFFRETTDMLDGGKHSELVRERLQYRKVKDLNDETHGEGSVIRAAEFHPSAAVALVAGLNGTASLFQVDGKLNPKVQSVNFSDFPIKTAHFSHDGSEFICGSQRASHLQVFDLGSARASRVEAGRRLGQGAVQRFEVSPAGDYLAALGRFGQVHLLSARTKELAFSLKMNDDVTCAAFAPGGQNLYTHGAGGEIYLWDVRQSRSCLYKFSDDGCVRGTALAVSPDGRRLAAGADSGVVNLYDAREVARSKAHKPEKAFMNLTTLVTTLKFNPTSELLAMASESKENAIKLAHVSSKTVFANFPSWNFNLKRVNCLDFSLNGGFLSVGNNRGAANLYRIGHYGSF